MKLVVCHRNTSWLRLVRVLNRVWCKFLTFSVVNKTPLLHSKQAGAGLVKDPGSNDKVEEATQADAFNQTKQQHPKKKEKLSTPMLQNEHYSAGLSKRLSVKKESHLLREAGRLRLPS